MKRHGMLAGLVACVVLAGCATNRSEIQLAAPAAVAPAQGSVKGDVVIRSVKDERVFGVFEQALGDPSTPSLGFEVADKATAELRARAVARKAKPWGKGWGDVVLQQGTTVEDVVRDNLTAALRQAGYQVRGGDSGGPSALVLDVHIKQFWAWFQLRIYGYDQWALIMNANITTELDVSGTTGASTITVHVEGRRGMVRDSAWVAIIDTALDAYRSQAAEKAASWR